jgi:hypothetical protein
MLSKHLTLIQRPRVEGVLQAVAQEIESDHGEEY